VSPVRHELISYIPEDDILHCHRCENLRSCSVFSVCHSALGSVSSVSSGGPFVSIRPRSVGDIPLPVASPTMKTFLSAVT
jgi:hypothetical protein